MDRRKLCIYVSSPDSYSDVFDVFLKAFELNWNRCKYPIIISSNRPKKLPEKYHFKLIAVDNDNWVTRTIKCLSEIDYEYILLMMDDAIILDKVDDKEIDKLINEMDQYKINYCKLARPQKGMPFKTSKYMNKVRKDTPYAINIFMGIYRREFLLSILGDGTLSAWDIERLMLEKAGKSCGEVFFDDVTACNRWIVKATNGVIGGKWFHSVKKKVKKMGIEIKGTRSTVSAITELKMSIGSTLGKSLSPKTRLKFKKIMIKFGFKFATDK